MAAGEGDLRAILFADLAGFTALTEAHGDLGAADVAGRFVELARSVLT
jgi:adenylate cyclase